jgi:hypothetical protein
MVEFSWLGLRPAAYIYRLALRTRRRFPVSKDGRSQIVVTFWRACAAVRTKEIPLRQEDIGLVRTSEERAFSARMVIAEVIVLRQVKSVMPKAPPRRFAESASCPVIREEWVRPREN